MDSLEIWKDINDYVGFYQVSNLGRVKSLKREVEKNNRIFTLKEIIKSTPIGKRGYFVVSLFKGSKGKTFTLHRLIANAFIPNEENKSQVNHINGNKLDNNIQNLEWVSNRENSCHQIKQKFMTSKYTGVSYFKRDNKWRSGIQVNGISIRFGMFDTEEEAYQKRYDYEKSNNIENKYL